MQNPTRCPLWVLALVKNLPFTVLETTQSREIDHRSRGLIRDYFVENICPKLIVGLIIKTHHCFGETINQPSRKEQELCDGKQTSSWIYLEIREGTCNEDGSEWEG